MYFVLQALAIAVLGSLPIAKLGYALMGSMEKPCTSDGEIIGNPEVIII